VRFSATEARVEAKNPVRSAIFVIVCSDEASAEEGEEVLETVCRVGFFEEELRIGVDFRGVGTVGDVREACGELVF
jgi:hypothetical protein